MQKTIYLNILLLVLLIAGCVQRDANLEPRNITADELAESILSALATSDYTAMKGNLLSDIELHRIIMQRKLDEHYRNLNRSEKREYDEQVVVLQQYVKHLDETFETEFWTLLNLGQNKLGIDWHAATVLKVESLFTEEDFDHQPIYKLNIRLACESKKYLLSIDKVIQTPYGWRILSESIMIHPVTDVPVDKSEEPKSLEDMI